MIKIDKITRKTRVYLVFIHKGDNLVYGGYFSTRKKAEAICKEWNKANGNENQFADFINVTDEKDDAFILRDLMKGDTL